MKRLGVILIASAILAALPAQAQITAFKHIVVIVQENRTPDNLFWELCQQAPCSDTGDSSHYDIKIDGWNNKGKLVTPAPVDLAINWDIEHHHDFDWVSMCDEQNGNGPCLMDGAAGEVCKPGNTNGCTTNNNLPEFTYVQRYNGATDVLGPYIDLALTYGWANKMFATNQGPSFPAHQFIYGGTSAPIVNRTENDDANGRYAAENATGCLDTRNVTVIKQGNENSTTFPCFTHQTLGTLFIWPNTTMWRYYTPGEKGLWTAPEAILSECGASNQRGGVTSCPGPEFQGGTNANVVTDPKQVLTDIGNCQLRDLNWVIPQGQYSDHAGIDTDYGPQWVASIVNTIGTSQCTDNGSTYWQDTAIIITWDDWGGWFDHESPQLNTTLGYQLGFRVPMLFVSAYGPNNASGQCLPYIDANDILDFGSIADFIEGNFLGGWSPANEGKLGFANSRALHRGDQFPDLSNFVKLSQPACTFVPIPTWANTQYFINDTSPLLPPDDE